MGKVEKVIVLSVLFLVALILVVTITVDDPLDKTNLVEAGGKKVAPAVAQAPAAAAPNPLLNATVQLPAPTQPSGAAPVVGATPTNGVVPGASTLAAPPPSTLAAPVAGSNAQPADAQAPAMASGPKLPPGALLKTMDGLQDSWFAELKLYTWREGDSWRKLADHYYGDWKRTDILKRSNEGRMDVEVGETVFVPVFENERTMQAAAQPTATKAAPGTVPVAATSNAVTPATSKSAAKTAATLPTGKKMHTVANGESLWKIAKAELGDGNRWKEIYEANRDVLDKPESIKKGMRLRIP